MVKQQAFNQRIQAWVIFDFKKGKGFRPLNVKQREPKKPFKGIKITAKSKRFAKR